MSYDINFMVKVDGVENKYIDTRYCCANITWNLREMIVKSTGLDWKNEENNGLCKDIIPKIKAGLNELTFNEEKYKEYESPNGWGTIRGCKNFFNKIIKDWELFLFDHEDLEDAVYFWIV